MLLWLSLPALALAGCRREPVDREALVVGARADRAPELVQKYGCGTCHEVPGVAGANGRVGPPLSGLGARRVIAGRLPNTPENLVRWIVYPAAIDPNTVMPVTGITPDEARDVAAYLYRRR